MVGARWSMAGEHGPETRATVTEATRTGEEAQVRAASNAGTLARAAKEWDRALTANGPEELASEAGLHRDALATLGAPAREHRLSGLGFHPAAKSVCFGPAAPVGLERALRHEK